MNKVHQEHNINGFVTKLVSDDSTISVILESPKGEIRTIMFWDTAMESPTGGEVNKAYQSIVTAVKGIVLNSDAISANVLNP